jgi:hypothetical protein
MIATQAALKKIMKKALFTTDFTMISSSCCSSKVLTPEVN